ERAAEALLLRPDPFVDGGLLATQLRILLSHDLDHLVREAAEKACLEADRAPLLDRAPHHAAQDVAAVLVRRHDPVRDQERRRAAVVGEDAEGPRGGRILPVAAPRQTLPKLDQGTELVVL